MRPIGRRYYLFLKRLLLVVIGNNGNPTCALVNSEPIRSVRLWTSVRVKLPLLKDYPAGILGVSPSLNRITKSSDEGLTLAMSAS